MPDTFKQWFKLDHLESKIVFYSAGYFFLLLCAYYVLRPVRETMGVARSADDLPVIFLGTMATTLLVAPLIGALVSKYQRRQFIPMAYRFISAMLVLFFAALVLLPESMLFPVGIGFYVFLSVANMLLVSLFWGFIADGITFEKGKQLFPSIAIGGTLGAILGSSIAQLFVEWLGQAMLLLIAVALLELALIIMKKVDRLFISQTSQPINDSLIQHPTIAISLEPPQSQFQQWTSGIRFALSSPYILAIAGYIFFYGLTSTFLYFQQGQLVAAASQDHNERTQIFAGIDLYANLLTLLMQLFISKKLLSRFGVGVILAGLPLLTLSGFAILSFYPILSVLIVFQAIRRSLNYGLFKPAREILFTLLPTEQKYKAKSFVDTFIYRGGDAIGAVSQKALTALSLGVGSIALLTVPVAAIWTFLAIYLGRQTQREHQAQSDNKDANEG